MASCFSFLSHCGTLNQLINQLVNPGCCEDILKGCVFEKLRYEFFPYGLKVILAPLQIWRVE
jgi:hypothetical protein